MAGLNLTTASEALKDDYQPTIREQLNQNIFLLTQIESTSKDVEGLAAVIDLHVGRNTGVGARSENGTLPTAGSQSYKQERVGLHYQYGRIQLSGPVIKAMKSDKGSFTRALDSEVKGVTRDLKNDVNRQLYGTSDGVIATCGTTSSSITVVLDTATPVSALRQLQDSMVVDIGTVGSPTAVAAATLISAVNFTAKTVTVASAVSTTSADFIFRSGAGGTGVELTGLQTIVDSTGTLFNVNPSTYSVWSSYEVGSVGAISDTVFQTAMDEIHIKSGEDVDLFLTTYGVVRAYEATLTAQKRFTNTLELKGGFSAISVASGRGDTALKADHACPDGTAFGLNWGHLVEHQASDWEWMDSDGAVLSRVPNTDAYEATLYKYNELTTDQRNAHGKLTGITEA